MYAWPLEVKVSHHKKDFAVDPLNIKWNSIFRGFEVSTFNYEKLSWNYSRILFCASVC